MAIFQSILVSSIYSGVGSEKYSLFDRDKDIKITFNIQGLTFMLMSDMIFKCTFS